MTREKQLNIIISVGKKISTASFNGTFFKQFSQSDVLNVWLQVVKNINF
jgi:hypothetical protein